MKGEDDADEVRCLGMGFRSSFDSAIIGEDLVRCWPFEFRQIRGYENW